MYKIAIIGLGYVGLPLAIELSKYYRVIGYDHFEKRICCSVSLIIVNPLSII